MHFDADLESLHILLAFTYKMNLTSIDDCRFTLVKICTVPIQGLKKPTSAIYRYYHIIWKYFNVFTFVEHYNFETKPVETNTKTY